MIQLSKKKRLRKSSNKSKWLMICCLIQRNDSSMILEVLMSMEMQMELQVVLMTLQVLETLLVCFQEAATLVLKALVLVDKEAWA